jgi:hypothetical protein
MVQLLWKMSDFSSNNSTELLCDPVIPLPGIYPREMKIYVHIIQIHECL